MAGRKRWKVEREVSLTREQCWFLKALVGMSRSAIPTEGPASAARTLTDEVSNKLERALNQRRW